MRQNPPLQPGQRSVVCCNYTVRPVVRPYLQWIGPVDRILKAAALSPFVSQTLIALDVKRSKADLETLAELIDAGKLKPVIDRTYALEEVPEAVRYVERGHARGKVLISIDRAR